MSGPTEQEPKVVKENDDASVEPQDSHVSAQSIVPEADEAPSSSESSEEQKEQCSTTETQSAGAQSAGRPQELSQHPKLKAQEESTAKDLMEYQDDLSDADYTPGQSVFPVSCFALHATMSLFSTHSVCVKCFSTVLSVLLSEISHRVATRRSCISTRRSKSKSVPHGMSMPGKPPPLSCYNCNPRTFSLLVILLCIFVP